MSEEKIMKGVVECDERSWKKSLSSINPESQSISLARRGGLSKWGWGLLEHKLD